jgi:hypothetical protein
VAVDPCLEVSDFRFHVVQFATASRASR